MFDLVGVLECAGNGRRFYEPHMAGAQWAFGSVGNGRWTGVRLRDVLEKAGIQSSAKEILCDGADVPLGTMPDFQRTITVAKALHPDTLLAYQMNGQPLPMEHGFPLRVVAPGWAGDSWVKWLQHIEVLDHEFEGFWMKSAYRHPTHPVAPGTAVDLSEMVPVTDLGVKSVIAAPTGWKRPSPGLVRIQGTAWVEQFAGQEGRRDFHRRRVDLEAERNWVDRQPNMVGASGNLIGRRPKAPGTSNGARHEHGRPDRSRSARNGTRTVTCGMRCSPSQSPSLRKPLRALPGIFRNRPNRKATRQRASVATMST